MKLNDWQSKIQDIRFWVLLFFIIRLYGITNPPIDPASTWRQCDVLMIARNFYDTGANIFYPRIALGSAEGSIVGVEFPIYNYLIYLLSVIFGYQDWYGRIINLVISSVALLSMHKTLSRYLSKEVAFNAAMLLLFSGWFSYARITIPDVFGASLCIIALEFALCYLEKGKVSDLLFFTAIASVGCLSKITSAIFLTILAAPMLDRQFLMPRKVGLTLSALAILCLVCSWYFYWVPHLNSIGWSGYFFMGKSICDGFREIMSEPMAYLTEIYETPLKYVGGTFFLFTIAFAIWRGRAKMLLALSVPLLAFVVFLLKSGNAFLINGYYFLIIVPAVALIAGFGLSLIENRKLQVALLFIIAVENIANQVHVFQVRPTYQSYTQLEGIFDSIGSTRKDAIAIGNDDSSPMAIYFCHRNGWNVPIHSLEDEGAVKRLVDQGCRYILILKGTFGDVNLPYTEVFSSDDFKIYKLL